jgi:hypothetical protein
MALSIGKIMSDTEQNRAMISFWDGGRCHLTRSMTLAAEMINRSFVVGAITSEKYAKEISSVLGTENTFVVPNRPQQVKNPPYTFPLYSHAFRHAQRLMGLGFDDTSWLQNVTNSEISALKAFEPDVVVNDYRDTIRTSAEYLDIPVVAINHTTGNVDGHRFAWWMNPPEGTILPDCLDSFNQVRSSLGLRAIVDERYMFSGDHNLIPSIDDIDPLANESQNSTYVGMLSSWSRNDSFVPIKDGFKPKIFSYASGEITRPQYGLELMLSEVMTRESNTGFYVVAGDPERYTTDIVSSARSLGRLMLAPYIPGYDATMDSDIVLTQGGNATVALSLSLGKPMVCIGPPQSDCSSIFRGVEENHAGIMLSHSTGALESIKAPDLGDDVDIFGYWSSEITSDSISSAIHKVVDDPSYAENARRLGEKLLSLGGARAAVDVITKTIEDAR